MEELFYYTGIIIWTIIVSVFFAVAWITWLTLWRREVRPSIKNLWFAIAAPKYWPKMSYYDKWRQLYEKPGLRKFWKKRHNHYSRVAYKRLVREAWKERNKVKPNKK